MKIIDRDCPLCGSNAAQRVPYGPDQWPMVRCGQCDMVYLKRAPDVTELFENIAWEKSRTIEDKRRSVKRGVARKLSRLTRKRLHVGPRKQPSTLIRQYVGSGNVLDIGCGPGGHALELPTPYVPYGIEVSKALADEGQPHFAKRGGCIVNLDALGGLRTFEDEMFSGIIMRSFLEHDIHPRPILEESSRTLKRGGIIVIKVPNYGSWNRALRGDNWCGMRFPDHVNYFTPTTLSRMVRETGLKVHKFGLLDRLPTSDNMWMIAVKP